MLRPRSAQSARRNLLIVLGIAVAVIVYSFGIDQTDIDLRETQDETRQSSVTRALRELLSPDIFDRDSESQFAVLPMQLGCEDGAAAEVAAPSGGEPMLVVSASCVASGDVVTVEGFNFRPNTPVVLRWNPPNGESRLLPPVGTEQNVFDVDSDGYFETQITIPRIRGGEDVHQLQAEARWGIGLPYASGTTHLVIEKMIETILTALMATSLAIPIAFTLSFLAARNLMRQVSVPAGNIFIGVLLLPVGWVLGTLVYGAVGQFGVDLGSGELFDDATVSAAPVMLLLFASVVGGVKRKRKVATTDMSMRVRAFGFNLLFAAIGIFVLGLFGGLALTIGGAESYDALVEGAAIPGFLINALIGLVGVLAGALLASSASASMSRELRERFDRKIQYAVGGIIGVLVVAGFVNSSIYLTVSRALATVGDIIDLTIVGIAGIAGAALLASFSVNIGQHILKEVRGVESHVGGFILGGMTGATVLGLVALLGTQGALLGLFAPIVAAVLGAQTAAALYNYGFNVDKRKYNVTTSQATGRLIVSIIGAVLLFVIAAEMLDLSRALVQGRLPTADNFQFFGITFPVSSFVGKAMLIGGVLSGIMGALSGLHASIPVGMTVYSSTRTILNAMRSIEPLIMGIVFVIWVGVGPFAGVLALGLHSIASLGKLYSEQIENIDNGPLEAIQSTGATRLQTIIYGVVPQIIPPYIAFTLYRWDINVRMSTIIGFVGGGGIGFILQQQINLLQYRDAGVAMLAIALVVSALDYLSATIRERII